MVRTRRRSDPCRGVARIASTGERPGEFGLGRADHQREDCVESREAIVPAFRNSRGLQLHATDVEWRHGDSGPLVEGRGSELVSVLGSRPRMLSALRGDGVELLSSRISPPRIRRGG